MNTYLPLSYQQQREEGTQTHNTAPHKPDARHERTSTSNKRSGGGYLRQRWWRELLSMTSLAVSKDKESFI